MPLARARCESINSRPPGPCSHGGKSRPLNRAVSTFGGITSPVTVDIVTPTGQRLNAGLLRLKRSDGGALVKCFGRVHLSAKQREAIRLIDLPFRCGIPRAVVRKRAYEWKIA